MSDSELKARRQPSEITSAVNSSTKRRLLIVLSFPLLVLLAVPFWWYTTAIERLPLPKERIAQLEIAPELSIRSQVLFTADSGAFPPPREGKAQFGVIDILESLAKEAKKGVDGIYNQRRPPRPVRSWDIITQAKKGQTPALRVHFRPSEYANKAFPLEPYIQAPDAGAFTSGIPDGTLVIPVHPSQVHDRFLKEHLRIAVTRSLLDLCPGDLPEIALSALKYSPNITLSFVLLNENSAEESFARDWDIQDTIKEHFLPHLQALAPIHNFTIESQVLYHAPLSFQPTYGSVPSDSDTSELDRALEAAKQGDNTAEDIAKSLLARETGKAWLVDEDQMKEFVNSERWSLDSGSSNNPVLRFLLFIPSAKHRPMRLAVPDSAQAFLLPQFGGVVILNPPDSVDDLSEPFDLPSSALKSTFHLFTQHLYDLLALPNLPSSIHPPPPASPVHAPLDLIQPLTPWQLDTLLRVRGRETGDEARKTLVGITRLVDKIEEMKVGEGVRGKVLGAVERLEKLSTLHSPDPLKAFLLSRDAVGLANEAFFDPSMMGLLYFPDEHKFAVYTPLFGPIALPMLLSLIKEILSWNKKRKGRQCIRSGAIDEGSTAQESSIEDAALIDEGSRTSVKPDVLGAEGAGMKPRRVRLTR